MTIWAILALMLFMSVSITHLVLAFLLKEKGRKITKCLVMFSLIIFLMAYQVKNPLLYVGAFFSLIGDAFLIFPQNRKFFVFGAIAFFISHILYIIVLGILLPPQFNWCYYGIILGVGYLLIDSLRRFFVKTMEKLTIPCLCYMYILLVEMVSSFILLVTSPSIMTIIILIGVICFLTSDVILTYTVFKKSFKRANFYLMIPYIIAQACILIGLASMLK